MSFDRRILKLYSMVLRWYPTGFRKQYTDQMLVTAEDLLSEAQVAAQTIRVSSLLLSDLLLTLIKENVKQLGGTMRKQITTPRAMLAAIKLGAQIVGIGTMAYLSILPILTFFPAPKDQYAGIVERLIPLILLGLAASIVRTASRLSLWQKIVWSFGLELAGTLCYIALVTTMNAFSHLFVEYWQEWVLAGLFCVGFYLTATKLIGRPRAKVQYE